MVVVQMNMLLILLCREANFSSNWSQLESKLQKVEGSLFRTLRSNPRDKEALGVVIPGLRGSKEQRSPSKSRVSNKAGCPRPSSY